MVIGSSRILATILLLCLYKLFTVEMAAILRPCLNMFANDNFCKQARSPYYYEQQVKPHQSQQSILHDILLHIIGSILQDL